MNENIYINLIKHLNIFKIQLNICILYHAINSVIQFLTHLFVYLSILTLG